jgi:Arc/MetJ-type ribon-helix-helix transcriptional regulator
MPKKLTIRLDDEFEADTEALTRSGSNNLSETVKIALGEAVERRQEDPAFRRRVRQIIEEDQELLERLAE